MDLKAHLCRLGFEAAEITPLHGGDLSEVFRVETRDGPLTVKSGPHVGVEARMLTTLARQGAPVPMVLKTDDTLLVMEYLAKAPATDDKWRQLGHSLRNLHDLTNETHGWSEDYAFGSVRLDNRATPDWPSFWAERRVLPFTRDFPDLAPELERASARLPDLLPIQATGLLHGDLWSGNLHFSPTGGHLIDPACYYGDGEVDLAMLHLFGTPPAAFSDGYGPLAPGWQNRRAAYQLFPALVHLRLFGAGYMGLVRRCLSQIG